MNQLLVDDSIQGVEAGYPNGYGTCFRNRKNVEVLMLMGWTKLSATAIGLFADVTQFVAFGSLACSKVKPGKFVFQTSSMMLPLFAIFKLG